MHPDFLTINDGQNLIPELVERYASLPLQMIFFGALISAILSTSSGAMLAPATIIGENIIKPRFKTISDKNLLLTTRFSVVLVAALSCIIAAMSGNIHGLVVISSVVMLVSLFAPFTLGLFWKKTSVFGAWSGLILGAAVYLTCFLMETAIEPFIYALVASIASTVIGSYITPDDTGAQFFNNQ
jgi:Na+/proline symporter